MPIAIVIHGGAWNIPDDAVAPSRDGVRAALEIGWKTLKDGGSALDAIEHSIRELENNPVFDAGRGSHLNREGKVEMDASIMDGRKLRAGAVAAIQRVRHPVSVARRVMEESPHVMLVGNGARAFAEEAGVELCRTRDLLCGRERERYLRIRAGEWDLVSKEFDPDPPSDPHSMGTVGAVAIDGNGDIAAATSTGGTQDKLPGRVGDTPIIGAGTYADGRVGAGSATGWGEGILRVVLTKNAVDLMAAGLAPTDAGLRALSNLDRVRGKAGLILLDRWGRTASVFTTPRMARGWSTPDGRLHVAVDPGDHDS